jgi:hypothetical protein
VGSASVASKAVAQREFREMGLHRFGAGLMIRRSTRAAAGALGGSRKGRRSRGHVPAHLKAVFTVRLLVAADR